MSSPKSCNSEKFIPSNILDALKKGTTAEILSDPVSQTIYSVDASIFEIIPLAIALPKTTEEIREIIKIAKEFSIPLIPRGSATGITGGCLGEGIILDTSKYFTAIEYTADCAVCQPGVIQDHLNQILLPLGKRLGPDTSTGDRATIGGMAANNAAGSRSLYYGSMKDAIQSCMLILSNGDIIECKALNEEEWKEKLLLDTQEGVIYRTLNKIRLEKKDVIEKHYPDLPRRSSGYNLKELLKPFPINIARLIAGSEGTLGIIALLHLKTVPVLPKTSLHLYPFSSLVEAMESVPSLLKHSPVSLELIDDKILEAGLLSPALRGKFDWLPSIPKALLIAEYTDTPAIKGSVVLSTKKTMQHVWDVRKAGLGLLLSKRSYSRAIAFIEDISVPPEALGCFMKTFLSYLKSQGKEAGIYGHAGPGCLHIRPYMDIRDSKEVELLKTIMQDVAVMLKKAKGALSGEHGDGLIRTWLNESFFEKEIYEVFQEVKNAFDPFNLMNPHKIVNPMPFENLLRKPPKQDPKTFLHFDGGIALAADLCNGNGACRKMQGSMCPSFQVTKNEYDTTRGRANQLRKLMQSEKPNALADESLHQILDLCIQCKGCKTECPSQVDMAKMKAEALYHYQEKHGYSLRNALFAYIDKFNALPFRKLFSLIPQSFLKILGIAHPLPSFAKIRFSKTKIQQPKGKQVILLADTYTEFYNPEVGLAAIRLLNKLGFYAIVPSWECCGRPAISKGFLNHAKKRAETLTAQLKPYIKEKIPIIGLEPSCFFSFFDEYPDMIPDWDPSYCFFFDSFLNRHFFPFKIKAKQVAVHGHCHHKAIEGMQNTISFLQRLPNLEVIEIPSGCCGMAGSFGYESEHAEFSKKIGDLSLLPFIQNLPSDIDVIASGYSCRTQIQMHTNKKPWHLAEWLERNLV